MAYPKRYKGDCMMCAHWIRGDGMAIRLPARDRRRLGIKRRLSRHQLTRDDDRYREGRG